MVISGHCQLDEIWDRLGDELPGKPVRVCTVVCLVEPQDRPVRGYLNCVI